MKEIRISTWGSKNLSIRGWCLAKVNYSNYDNFKFIETFKYFQTTLSNLSSTTDKKEKKNIESVLDVFISNHSYFGKIYIAKKQKKKVLDIWVGGKGVIPYEKIVDMNSLDISPKDVVFLFIVNLSKKILQMIKTLNHMNDLYNAQDTMLLCEIIEN